MKQSLLRFRYLESEQVPIMLEEDVDYVHIFGYDGVVNSCVPRFIIYIPGLSLFIDSTVSVEALLNFSNFVILYSSDQLVIGLHFLLPEALPRLRMDINLAFRIK